MEAFFKTSKLFSFIFAVVGCRLWLCIMHVTVSPFSPHLLSLSLSDSLSKQKLIYMFMIYIHLSFIFGFLSFSCWVWLNSNKEKNKTKQNPLIYSKGSGESEGSSHQVLWESRELINGVIILHSLNVTKPLLLNPFTCNCSPLSLSLSYFLSS